MPAATPATDPTPNAMAAASSTPAPGATPTTVAADSPTPAAAMPTTVAADSPTPAAAPPPSSLATDLYALVVFLHKNCNSDLFEAMGVLELGITQIKLLHQLETATRELTLKEAAELVPLSLPAASRTIDDLVRRGMVERHEDTDDRRMKRVSLTDRGRHVIRKLNAARLNGLEQFAHSLNEDERRALAAALQQLLSRADVAACRPEGI